RADAGGQYLQETAARYGPGENVAALGFLYRDRFAGDGGLIDCPGAGNVLTVQRHSCAFFDQDDLANPHLAGSDLLFLTVVHDDRRVGRDGDEFGQCRARLVQRRGFQRVADREQERDCRGLPEVTDNDRTDRRDGHEQVDADDLGDQRTHGLHHNPVSGNRGGGDHEDVPEGEDAGGVGGVGACVEPPPWADGEVGGTVGQPLDGECDDDEHGGHDGNRPVPIQPFL